MEEGLKCTSLGAMGSLLRKLDDLAHIEDRARQLRDDLASIKTKLEKLSEVDNPSLIVKIWMKDVRELSYDMEDCIDWFIQADDTDAKMAWINDLLGFKTRVEEARERYHRFNLGYGLNHHTTTISHRFRAVYHEPRPVVPIGMEGPTNKLRRLVEPNSDDENNRQLKVVSILGVDGVGKSTLAQKLWGEVGGQFECQAFVQTAKKPDMRMILRCILSQIHLQQSPEACQVPNLIHDIRKHLQDKRYFIIIDDLWAVAVWDTLSHSFPEGNNCSRIMTTTTIEDVALACCSYDPAHIFRMEPLDAKHSNQLFIKKVYGTGEGCSQQFNYDIVKRCGGLPLAITCVASLVASHWEILQKRECLRKFLSDNFRISSTSVEILKQVLDLCYNCLPRCLKTCLMYLSMYPENYLILKEDLVKLWIAEDFICSTEEDILEVASSYFDDLMSLGLIQRMDINCIQKERSYIVHPTVFDFITCKSIEENFITVIDYSQSTVALTEKIRRLSLQFGSATYATAPGSITHWQVRSLSFMGLLNCMPSLLDFMLVRVIILHVLIDNTDKRLPLTGICRLSLLKYLHVRCNATVELPDRIRCLKHLETLEIHARLAAVPSDILLLPKLLHLRLGKIYFKEETDFLLDEEMSNDQPGGLVGTKSGEDTIEHAETSRSKDGRPVNSASMGAMGSLHRKLDELQTEDKTICKFRNYVGIIYEQLEKLSEVHDPPRTVNYWMKEVRELSYDMDDFVNGFVHASDAKTMVGKISEFEAEVVDAIQRYKCYNLENFLKKESDDTEVKIGPRLMFADTELIGIDDRMKELRSKLKSNDKEHSQLMVISIVSVDQGVGKSTLAQKLWRDELAAKENQSETELCCAFVLMSKKPDMRMILRSIMSQVCMHEPPGNYSVPNLIHDIRMHLQNRRYFIVIDDLWAISVWDIVRRAFPDGKNCSRIVITTTIRDIAHACCSERDIVDFKPLSDEECIELFFRRVFGPGKEHRQQLNVVSDVTRKCGGLPLAIICIATLVASKQETEQDLDFAKMEQQLNNIKYFLDNNLTTRPTSMDILNQVLKLCYSSLPSCLRTCLLYLSMYPENYFITKGDLVKQWIAEGFIVGEGKSTVKTAESYFDVLVSLGLIQRMDIYYTKQQHFRENAIEDNGDQKEEENKERLELQVDEEEDPLQYVVHPMIFEFIAGKSKEDNFITIIDYSQSKVALTERIHRLSLHFGSATYATTPTAIKMSEVRSLAFMGLLNCMPSSLLEFKVVRVLILHIQSDGRDKVFSLKEARELGLLRYLQVRCNATVELPSEVQCLENLKTLEINARVKNDVPFPSDLVYHAALQNVRIGKKMGYKILDKDTVITSNESNIKDELERKHLSAIEVFVLLPPICIFSKLPGWIEQLTSLRILEVVVRELGKYELDHLGKLPVLTVLSLYVRKPGRGVVTFHTDTVAPSFPALEYFKLVSGVLFVRFPEKAMPKLLRLKICFNARRGGNNSDILGNIQHLEKLKEVVASIGLAAGAEETDRIAAESALQDTVGKHPKGPMLVKGECLVDPVDEEYDPPEIQKKLKFQEIQETVSSYDMAASQLPASPAPWQQSHKMIWRRAEQSGNAYTMLGAVSESLGRVVGKLGSLLKQVDNLSRKRIRSLLGEISDIQEEIVRYGCEPLHHLDSSTLDWVDRVRRLSDQIEDWTDCGTLFGEDDNPSSSSSFLWWLHGSWFASILDEIEELRNHPIFIAMKDFKDRAVVLSGQQPCRYRAAVPPPARLPFFWRDSFTRFIEHGGPTEEVINMVMNVRGMDELKIFSIIGMAGSGKTTLAAAIYQRLQPEFDSSIFVSVGSGPNMVVNTLRNMLRKLEMGNRGSRDIFSQLQREEEEEEDMPRNLQMEGTVSLTLKLRDLLENKRYLIVFDDLCSWDHWEIFRDCFTEADLHSRIIITTRSDQVALHCSSGSSDCIYKLGLLSDADSKQLLLNEVFRNRYDFPKHLEGILEEIIQKCGGLPLAILSVAAMLAVAPHHSEDEWRRIGLNMLSNPDANYLMQRLNLSYDDLPPHLKICMLYLSIFPEYYEIEVERLVRLWIAEAFIFEEGRTMEETARSYLDGLISRNMVIPLHVNHDDIPKYCMVHPVIHAFLADKSKKENFVAIVNDQYQNISSNSGYISRLSVQSSNKQDQNVERYGFMHLSRVHSIIIVGHVSNAPRLTDLWMVRILDLEGCDGPVRLGRLHHLLLLKYLNLRGTDVSELPETIGELRYLQTLDLRSTNVKQLPVSIVSLEKLIHLLCGSAKLPRGISKVKAVQILSCGLAMNSSTSIIQELSELEDLRELELFYDFSEIPANGRLVKFPGYGFRLLEKLRIHCCSASLTFEPSVLPRVKILELRFEGVLGEESTGVSGIEHLSSLNHVLLGFSKDGAGAMMIVDSVRKTAAMAHPKHLKVTVNVDGR